MERKELLSHIAALACVIIWGSTFVVSKDLMRFLSPMQLMCMRFSIAFVTLWIIHPKWNFSWRKEWVFLAMGVFGNTIYFLSENTALTLTYSSNVSILASTTSLISLFLMWALHYENVSRKQTMGFIIAFFGVVLVILNGTFVLHLEPMGDILALCAALSWSIYGLFLIRVADQYDSFLISRKIMFYGLITTLPLTLIEGKPLDIDSLLMPESIAGVLFLAVLGSCICYIFWNNSIKVLGVVRSNLYLYLMPLVTLIAGSIVFDETVTIMAVIGIALVVSGMYISNKYRAKNNKTD